ncbi:male-specific lethal 3 homolog [Eurytemora carolleeae]|uniref:male-specific lethal 3 homolog n=1 Tax=Eurytemora carolleeae TaxID=1294199 RepID=UPI000C75C9D9|nr:male-specific lethal 3 homolog [Eurytemora carolleeae]|eukprot:XP_023333669.1 male-specific lethal 3 homolog [Eurytemora affinis]
MVSTRGPKPKFDIGERVLCYEPDPKKIKMLYDAKILDLRPSQKGSPDEKNRRGFDYFVHFQGWNSSWDRFVADDMLLKDNEDTRKEQRLLYEETEEFKMRKDKSRKRKSTDKTRASLDSNPISPVPSDTSSEFKYQMKRGREERMSLLDSEDEEIQFKRNFSEELVNQSREELDYKEEHDPSSSPRENGNDDEPDDEKVEGGVDETEDICTEPIPLNLPQQLKTGLELDFKFISDGKLVKLPAQPNIITLLEGYVRNYAINRLSALEKQNQKQHQYRQPEKQESELFEDVIASINIVKEVAEGLRIIIDFHLSTFLLYPQESEQFIKSKSIRPHMESIERLVSESSPIPPLEPIVKTKSNSVKKDSSEEVVKKKPSRKSTKKESECENPLVHGSAGSTASASSGAETPVLPSSNHTQYPQSKKSHQILRELYSWKLLPESVYFEEPVPASLIYGGVHLARFMVKLPDIFLKMRFKNKKLKFISKFIEFLVEYISSQTDIFAPAVYQ